MNKSKNNAFYRLSTFVSTVIRRRYSLLEVPWRGIHNFIALAMSICVAVGNKVMDTPELPQPIKRHEAPKYDICSVGRSMIEMLGVLAIIAVLSVGGIAGYSKAMEKFKHNKWQQQIEDLIFNIKDAYKNERHYGRGTENILPTLQSMNIVPQDMLDENNRDLFGNKVSVVMREFNGWIRLNIQFDLQQNNQAQQNCMDLFALQPVYTNSIWTVAGSTSPTAYIEFYRLCGKVRPKEYVPGCKEEYVLTDVSKACSICKNTSCSILVLFDNNS